MCLGLGRSSRSVETVNIVARNPAVCGFLLSSPPGVHGARVGTQHQLPRLASSPPRPTRPQLAGEDVHLVPVSQADERMHSP